MSYNIPIYSLVNRLVRKELEISGEEAGSRLCGREMGLRKRLIKATDTG